ncbi:MAG: DUF3987 domain-containing protein [Chloroflexi bacterium]|nr:DUF3987 domain-containing protein [Chloroflexota bacterium]
MPENPNFQELRDQRVREALREVMPDKTDDQLDQIHFDATVRKVSPAVGRIVSDAIMGAAAEDKANRDAARNRTVFSDLIPLDVDWCDTPFPIECLPDWAHDYTAAAARSSQVPVEMAATTFLGALTTVTRGNVLVRGTDDYVEPAVLWLALVAASGERKSQNMRLMMGPATAVEAKVNADLAILIAQDAAKLEDLTAQVAAAQNALKSTKLTPDERHAAVADLAEATTRRDAFAPTLPVRLLADDATPEGIVSLLAANHEAISIASTEGNLFSIMTGRYSEKPFVEALLKAHNGDEIRVDRQGREAQYVANPRLSMTIAIQPSVLADIGKSKTLRGNGFIARILPTYPKPMAGRRTYRSDPIPTTVRDNYNARMEALGEAFIFLPQPLELVLSPDAIAQAEILFNLVEEQVGPAGDLAHMADWASKLTGAATRIAGLLHVAEHGANRSVVIDGPTMANACRIALYFLDHAKATHNVMSGRESAGDAQQALEWARKQAEPTFTVSEFAHGSARSWDEDRVNAALQTLVNHGYARIMDPSEYMKGKGRPSSHRLELRPTYEN